MTAPLVLVAVSLMRPVAGSVVTAERVKPAAAEMPPARSLAKSVPSEAVSPAVSSEKEKL